MDLSSTLTTIFSILGGTTLLAGVAKYFGELGASAILERYKHEHAIEIEELKNALAIFKDKELKSHHDKVTIYRSAFIPIIDLVHDFERSVIMGEPFTMDMLLDFNRNRLKAHAELAFFAPQAVLDEWDRLIDFLFITIGKLRRGEYDNGRSHQVWEEFRTLAFTLLNRVRADIGLVDGDVTYKGNL